MQSIYALTDNKNIRHLLLDAGALAFIYFVPALTHLLNVPVYLFEPMRIMLFIAIAFSSRNNTYLIALSLPVFSYLISSHPSIIKTGLITVELSINVFLYFSLVGVLGNKFSAAFLSIMFSKIIYYLLKFALISFAFMEGDLISTPVYIQLIVATVLSLLMFGFSFRRTDKY